jgi:hypothetical protein
MTATAPALQTALLIPPIVHTVLWLPFPAQDPLFVTVNGAACAPVLRPHALTSLVCYLP